MRPADADDYSGRTIAGKYRVEEMIGEGGMGKVYKARQLMLEKPVVLKVLRHALLSDERTVARFQREAKAASRLNHPNSISVIDFGQVEEGGALFIAMEYVHGKDLHQVLSRDWPLPEARIVRIMGQVLSALADAHSAGVIHRDLKPENIMVEQRRSEPDFVKVLDFGIAKIQDLTDADGPPLTRAGYVCGTPEYMSPEQARGAPIDHRSDLYAVGVILYQLMTGLLPFESDSAIGYATRHLNAEPPLPTRRRPEAKISPALERLIMKALSKDPKDRPQTAELFRAELMDVLRDRRSVNGALRAGASAVLAPVPRKATPADPGATRIQAPPGWTAPETTAPHETAPEAPALGRARRAISVALVAIPVGLAGWYLYGAGPSSKSPVPVYPNAPVPQLGAKNGAPVDARPLYERDIPKDEHLRGEAERLGRDADALMRRADLVGAAAKYEEAFAAFPDPELALKLGDVYFQRNQRAEAQGWWERHLREDPQSTAREYIRERLKPAAERAP